MVEPCQIGTIHVGDVARHFLPRKKLNFSLTGITGTKPSANFILQLTRLPNHTRDLKGKGGQTWAVSVNEMVCIHHQEELIVKIFYVLIQKKIIFIDIANSPRKVKWNLPVSESRFPSYQPLAHLKAAEQSP